MLPGHGNVEGALGFEQWTTLRLKVVFETHVNKLYPSSFLRGGNFNKWKNRVHGLCLRPWQPWDRVSVSKGRDARSNLNLIFQRLRRRHQKQAPQSTTASTSWICSSGTARPTLLDKVQRCSTGGSFVHDRVPSALYPGSEQTTPGLAGFRSCADTVNCFPGQFNRLPSLGNERKKWRDKRGERGPSRMKPQGVEDKGEVMLTTAARSLDGGLDAVLTLDKQTYSPRHDYHIASRLSIHCRPHCACALIALCVCRWHLTGMQR